MEYKLKIEESFYDNKEVTVVKFDVVWDQFWNFLTLMKTHLFVDE